jgi:hypothetical protein
MTTISTLAPAVHVPKAMNSSVAEAAPSAGSFAGLLDNSPSSTLSQNRAFTFAELGMFGRSHNVDAPDIASSGSNEVTFDAGEDPPAGNSFTSPGAALSPLMELQAQNASQVRSPVAHGAYFVGEYSEEQHQSAGKEAPLIVMSAELPESNAGLPSSSKDRGGAKLPTQPRSCQEANTVNLVVNGANGELNVLARDTGNNEEDHARLRRLLDGVAWEFGERIGGFYLNGSAVDQPFSAIIGGNHGDSAR